MARPQHEENLSKTSLVSAQRGTFRTGEKAASRRTLYPRWRTARSPAASRAVTATTGPNPGPNVLDSPEVFVPIEVPVASVPDSLLVDVSSSSVIVSVGSDVDVAASVGVSVDSDPVVVAVADGAGAVSPAVVVSVRVGVCVGVRVGICVKVSVVVGVCVRDSVVVAVSEVFSGASLAGVYNLYGMFTPE